MDLSQALKRIRKLKGIPQSQIAAAAGISTTQYQNYEYGKSEPTASVLSALADYLDVPIDYLMGRGLFANWEQIMEYKEPIIKMLESTNGFFKTLHLSQQSEPLIMPLFSALFAKIEINKETNEITVYFLLPEHDLENFTATITPLEP